MLPDYFNLDLAQHLHSKYRKLGAWDFYPDTEPLDEMPWHSNDYPGTYFDRYIDNFGNEEVVVDQKLIKTQDNVNNKMSWQKLTKYKSSSHTIFQIRHLYYSFDDKEYQQDYAYQFLCSLDDPNRVLEFGYLNLVTEYDSKWFDSDINKVNRAYNLKWYETQTKSDYWYDPTYA